MLFKTPLISHIIFNIPPITNKEMTPGRKPGVTETDKVKDDVSHTHTHLRERVFNVKIRK